MGDIAKSHTAKALADGSFNLMNLVLEIGQRRRDREAQEEQREYRNLTQMRELSETPGFSVGGDAPVSTVPKFKPRELNTPSDVFSGQRPGMAATPTAPSMSELASILGRDGAESMSASAPAASGPAPNTVGSKPKMEIPESFVMALGGYPPRTQPKPPAPRFPLSQEAMREPMLNDSRQMVGNLRARGGEMPVYFDATQTRPALARAKDERNREIFGKLRDLHPDAFTGAAYSADRDYTTDYNKNLEASAQERELIAAGYSPEEAHQQALHNHNLAGERRSAAAAVRAGEDQGLQRGAAARAAEGLRLNQESRAMQDAETYAHEMSKTGASYEQMHQVMSKLPQFSNLRDRLGSAIMRGRDKRVANPAKTDAQRKEEAAAAELRRGVIHKLQRPPENKFEQSIVDALQSGMDGKAVMESIRRSAAAGKKSPEEKDRLLQQAKAYLRPIYRE